MNKKVSDSEFKDVVVMAFTGATHERMLQYLQEINADLDKEGIEKKTSEYCYGQMKGVYMNGIVDALHILNIDNDDIEKKIAHFTNKLYEPFSTTGGAVND